MNAEAQSRPSQVVAGYLAALSIFACLVGLAWHPLRLIGPGIVLAMISAGMTGRQSRLSLVAVFVAAGCFFLGMTIAVVTSRPLW